MSLKNRKILIVIGGGISAYKALDLIRLLKKNNVEIKTILTKRELRIAKIVASDLKKNKIVFAGIDLISNYLTGDINITSPTGLKNFKDLTGIDLAVDIWNYLEKN